MEEKIQKIISLIEQSNLDETIKSILIRDLQSEGLTDFLREQIKAYCFEGLKRLNPTEEEAKLALEAVNAHNPAE